MLLRLKEWTAGIGRTGLETAKGELMFKQSEDFNPSRRHELVEKADTLDASDPAGAGRDSFLWVRATSGNPFLPYVQVMSAASGSSLEAPELLSAPALIHNTSSQSVNGNEGDLSDDSDLVKIDYQNYESKLRAAHPVVEDSQDFRGRYATMAAEQIFKQAGDNAFGHIKAASASGSPTVKVETQAGGSLPTSAQVADKLGAMIERVPGQHFGMGRLFVSPQLWRIMSAAQNADLTPGHWQGIPLTVTGTLDKGTGAGEVPAIFADLHQGYLFVVRTDFYVEASMKTEPPIFFARSRFGGAVLNGDAISVLRVAA